MQKVSFSFTYYSAFGDIIVENMQHQICQSVWDDGIKTRDASAVLPLYFAHVPKHGETRR